MVVDTSALIAIIFGEPDANSYLDALTRSEEPILLSAVTAVEAAIVVLARQGPEAASDLDLLRARVTAQVVPCDAGQVSAAIAGWRRFGKGRHSAALNLGDCFSYALARTSGDALLFKGRDFAQTDIRSVLP